MATRRGFGTLRRLPSKRWRATYVGPDLQRHTAPHTFASKGDAEVWLAQERALATGDGWVAPKRRAEIAERLAPPTFAEYARQWLADRSLKPRTREGYEHLLRAILSTAVTDELLASNPCRVRAASNPPTKKEIRPATVTELDLLVQELPAISVLSFCSAPGAPSGWGRS